MPTRSFFVLFCLLFTTRVWAGSVPALYARINDYAGVLSAETRQDLETQLQLQEKMSSNQIVILTIPSLAGEDIDTYAHRVFKEWKLGKANKDNGVLMLLAVNDHQIRIEVGYGLEGSLTDVLCRRIIRNEMKPYLKEGKYEMAVQQGINALIAATIGTYHADEPATKDNFPLAARLAIGLPMMLVLITFSWLMIVFVDRPRFLFVFLLLFYLIFPPLVFGWVIGLLLAVAYVVVFLLSQRYYRTPPGQVYLQQRLLKKQNSTSRSWTYASSSSWASDSSSSSWSSDSSSSSSDSSYSGDGGSSGGGGSSDSW